MPDEADICLTVCKQIVDAMRVPVVLADRQGRIVYLNQAAGKIAPGSPDVSLREWLDVDADLFDLLLPAEWWTRMDDPEPVTLSDVPPTLRGRPVAAIRRQRITGSHAEPLALLVFEWASAWEQRYLDTMKTQDGLAYALEAAEQRFNVLFRESSDPVLILGANGDILSANAGFERYTGLDAARWFSEEKSWADCVHKDDLPLLHRSLQGCVEQGITELVELRLLSNEEFYQWFELSLSPLHDDTQQVRGIVCVARNINRRKELETQLREEAHSMQKHHKRAQLLIAKLKHFFGRVSALPSDIDGYMHGVCETLNDMYRPTAVSIHVATEPPREYVAGTAELDHAGFVLPQSVADAVTTSGIPVYCNALNLTDPYRDDGAIRQQHFITCLAAPLRDSTGTIRGSLCMLDTDKQYYDNVDVELITVAALHVAARLRAEEQEVVNRELADHLRQAQKMEAVGLLAGGVAHDFNNILSGILGFSSYLLSKVDEEGPLHRDLKLIEQSAVRAADLTRQLLSFARRKHFAKQAVSLNHVIQEVLALIRRSVGREITIQENLEQELPLIHGDPGQLNQVMMNLCLNAAEAMPKESESLLHIATECRPLTPRERIILGEDIDDDFACVTIADNGIGMSEELQEHIYEPFYTTRAESGGTGLGLSIVYGIVTNHGGHLIVDSEEGHGSVFTLYFPTYPGEVETTEEAGPETLTGTETILVIDDESVVRQMVTAVLKGHGYQVISAESGRLGVQHLDELRGRVDLVLLDIIMPEMDGEATFKALRHIDPEIPVLLTSGYVQEEKRKRLMEAGALGLVHKPYKSEHLLRQLRQALNRAQRVAYTE